MYRCWRQEESVTHGWEQVVYTDGSKTEHGVGAGFVVPGDPEVAAAHMKVRGPQTGNRAELTAQYAAMEDLWHRGEMAIYTDSKFTIQKLLAWVADPGSLLGDPHEEIVREIGMRLAGAQGRFALHKIKAHVGLVGNELADGAAKHAANEQESPSVPARGVDALSCGGGVGLTLGEDRLTKPKTQLRPVVAGWLARREGYRTTLSEGWLESLDSIDVGPSQRHWKPGAPMRRPVVANIFRVRTGDYVCQHAHALAAR